MASNVIIQLPFLAVGGLAEQAGSSSVRQLGWKAHSRFSMVHAVAGDGNRFGRGVTNHTGPNQGHGSHGFELSMAGPASGRENGLIEL
ncbi:MULTISPECIES: hypothetical protein [unclassified Pseudarthrobacter]|uniref:hypothetical protein n=1 Tax=unclassified Pseudarthrobacter TaxID=2647000 RepID=UPI00362B89D5